MRNRAPLMISIAALVVALVGTTSVGQAAVSTVKSAIPPFAKTAAYATTAGNASKLDGHASSGNGLSGTIPVVGKNGKLAPTLFPATSQGIPGPAGPAGPAGAAGAAGPAGPAGVSKLQVVTNAVSNASTTFASGSVTATCPAGRKALGGGGLVTRTDGSVSGSTRQVYGSFPDTNGWTIEYQFAAIAGDPGYVATAYAVCASVAG